MKITLQRAMKARNLLKAEIADKINLLSISGYFEHEKYKKSEIDEQSVKKFLDSAPNIKVERLDGENRDKVYDYINSLQKSLYDLNIAIEKSNQAVHLLLIEETFVKSKLSLAQDILDNKRSQKEREEIDEMEVLISEKQSVRTPYIHVNAFAMTKDFVKEVKDLQKRLSEIRDEISVLNATTEVEVDLPEDFI